VEYVHYHSSSPEGQAAQLQAIAIITAGLDSDELLQQEMTAAIGPKPDPAEWVLLTIALGKIAIQITAVMADMDSENVHVVSGERQQFSPFGILQDFAQLVLRDRDAEGS
jgi:hypothetical protein